MAKIVGIGHVSIRVRDVAVAVRFYRETLGLKQVVATDTFQAFEVGDVHLCLMPGEPGTAHFDLTADDVPALHARLRAAGIACSDIARARWADHDYFTLHDPDGHELTIFSCHAPMPEVPPAI